MRPRGRRRNRCQNRPAGGGRGRRRLVAGSAIFNESESVTAAMQRLRSALQS
jgi:hypothetical protein